MSTGPAGSGQPVPGPSSQPGLGKATAPSAPLAAAPKKPQRVLACVLCQQRKVKCDRKFPCANCLKFKVPCVPATIVPRKRRRRFPERDLLDRIRKYEDIMRQNGLKFEPLHKDAGAGAGVERDSPRDDFDSDDEHKAHDEPSPSTTVRSDRVNEVKSIWRAMDHDHEYRDPLDESDEESYEVTIKRAFGGSYQNSDHLMFGQYQSIVELATLHPDPVQIFRLWQVYLDNVNTLLRVTHAPSMQPRIIEAATDLNSVDANLEALMFSIYAMAILSLGRDECESMFGESKDVLTRRYQFGCQQALLKAGYARSSDRDCLTAFHLYVITHRPKVDPRSLHSMLGVALRIAQRMGLHSESAHAKRSTLEAEMCRRLWWSLILFDARIGEAADWKSSVLEPSWDCRLPLNINESELRPEMKGSPAAHTNCSDAIFAVVRAELGEFLRYATFHLDFTYPALKNIAKEFRDGSVPEGEEVKALEKMIEDKYLRYCDPANPLHYMTIWTARTMIAKFYLVDRYSKMMENEGPRTPEQRDLLNSLAVNWVEIDTKMAERDVTKGFMWFADAYFPFPAYMQIVSDLKRRPMQDKAMHYWDALSDNFKHRWTFDDDEYSPIVHLFANMILQAWAPREAALLQEGEGEPLALPGIVSYLREKQEKIGAGAAVDTEMPEMPASLDELQVPMVPDFRDTSMLYSSLPAMGQPVGGGGMPGMQQAGMDLDMNQFNWAAFNWNPNGAGMAPFPATSSAAGPSPPGQASGLRDGMGQWGFK